MEQQYLERSDKRDYVVDHAKKTAAIELEKKRQTKRLKQGLDVIKEREEEEKASTELSEQVPHFDDLESGCGSSLELEGADDALMSLDMEMVIEEPPSEAVYQREL